MASAIKPISDMFAEKLSSPDTTTIQSRQSAEHETSTSIQELFLEVDSGVNSDSYGNRKCKNGRRQLHVPRSEPVPDEDRE